MALGNRSTKGWKVAPITCIITPHQYGATYGPQHSTTHYMYPIQGNTHMPECTCFITINRENLIGDYDGVLTVYQHAVCKIFKDYLKHLQLFPIILLLKWLVILVDVHKVTLTWILTRTMYIGHTIYWVIKHQWPHYQRFPQPVYVAMRLSMIVEIQVVTKIMRIMQRMRIVLTMIIVLRTSWCSSI